MSTEISIPKRPRRNFLPEDFAVSSWENLKPYFDKLLVREISDQEDLEKLLRDRSELESMISEDMGWRYIKMTCFTENQDYLNSYQDFVENIQPHISPISDLLNKKVMSSEFVKLIEGKEGYDMMLRSRYRSRNL